jgi:hypothetical protein
LSYAATVTVVLLSRTDVCTPLCVMRPGSRVAR